jgi:hypothetical protein
MRRDRRPNAPGAYPSDGVMSGATVLAASWNREGAQDMLRECVL